MSTSALGFLDENRSESVFLPTLVFGYVSTLSEPATRCFGFADPLYSLSGSSEIYLLMAVGSTILSAIMYAGRDSIIRPTKLSDIVSPFAVATLIHFLLLGISFVELILRACSNDLIIVSLLLIYVALFTMRGTEIGSG